MPLDYDVSVDFVPLLYLRYESAVAGCHRLWDMDFGLDSDDLLLIIRELARYVDVVYVSLTCNVGEYKRKNLRFRDVLGPSEGVELGCQHSVVVNDLVIEVNRYKFCRACVRTDSVAAGKSGDYCRDGTDVLDTCDGLCF